MLRQSWLQDTPMHTSKTCTGMTTNRLAKLSCGCEAASNLSEWQDIEQPTATGKKTRASTAGYFLGSIRCNLSGAAPDEAAALGEVARGAGAISCSGAGAMQKHSVSNARRVNSCLVSFLVVTVSA